MPLCLGHTPAGIGQRTYVSLLYDGFTHRYKGRAEGIYGAARVAERAGAVAVNGKKWLRPTVTVHLCSCHLLLDLSQCNVTDCGQILFSPAEHVPTMPSLMEIQPLFSRLACHENSASVAYV